MTLVSFSSVHPHRKIGEVICAGESQYYRHVTTGSQIWEKKCHEKENSSSKNAM